MSTEVTRDDLELIIKRLEARIDDLQRYVDKEVAGFCRWHSHVLASDEGPTTLCGAEVDPATACGCGAPVSCVVCAALNHEDMA